ncbi:hypothetical protein BHM03_00038999 [Ensete ventricosum]|nr:hypothetical protein BHM03_00038999 [Ensete ventricosum]
MLYRHLGLETWIVLPPPLTTVLWAHRGPMQCFFTNERCRCLQVEGIKTNEDIQILLSRTDGMKHLNRDCSGSFLLAPVSEVVVLSVYNACVRSWMSIKRLSTAGKPEIQPRVAPSGTSAVHLDVLDTVLLVLQMKSYPCVH